MFVSPEKTFSGSSTILLLRSDLEMKSRKAMYVNPPTKIK